MMETQHKKEAEELRGAKGKLQRIVERMNSAKGSKSFVENMKMWDGGEMQFHFTKSRGEASWTKFIEEFYTSYRKSIMRNTKHASLINSSRTNITSDLASIFRIARDHLKDNEVVKEPNSKLISLKQLKEVICPLTVVPERAAGLSEAKRIS
eukprot:TRINITY_DN682_c0_g5_i1.p1 TRINITY_DN682_c0_g5~~TRINITY_DN682_c0_g5_i1.p1  ORF type:complete len:152 (+),score=32.26 TRINITY_DN682_c0_g5_i1:579-1034(+)